VLTTPPYHEGMSQSQPPRATEGPQDLEADAREYLARELGPRAPARLLPEGRFDERPLEGEGATAIFSFDMQGRPGCAAEADARHYVAVGQTEPNYFPAYGLDPDEAYSLHIGTRFMLTMGVQRVEAELEPPQARQALRVFVARYAAGAELTGVELAGLFRCEEAYFAVYRLRLAGEELYCMGADCPPGFYRCTQYPPQMALRLHLGGVIRAEARAERDAGGT
jgi:hypothetical protein